MSDVKRYQKGGIWALPEDVRPDGNWVLASDYDALAAERDRVGRSMRESWANEKRLAARIRELEAALRLIADAKDVRGCDEIARQALGLTAETDCGHGQIVQNGCPSCERKIGYELTDDYTDDRGTKL